MWGQKHRDDAYVLYVDESKSKVVERAGDQRDEHTADVAHKYTRDELMPRWQGWHSFRRRLGTNLNHLGVDDTTMQAILRHENVATTQKYDIKPVSADSVRAMAALDTVLCSRFRLDGGHENAVAV
jgi:site-specific recombinase XerD